MGVGNLMAMPAHITATWQAAAPPEPPAPHRGASEEPTAAPDVSPYGPVLQYVTAFWDRLFRFHPHDEGTLIGLPRAYVVPSVDPVRPLFQEMYYWDSYFSALGLVGTLHEWLVFDLAENMAALVERFGFIPNGTRYYFTSRSQPPFFTKMYRLAHELKAARGDADADEYLRHMTRLGVREHETCWLGEKHPHERRKYRGLSRYHDINYSHFLASCESGWDHSTRCDGTEPGAEAGRWMDFLPVCLNSILYAREVDFAWAFARLGAATEADYWHRAAEERAATMNELMWDEGQGFFFDFDWKAERRSPCASLAGFYPLWAGFATQRQAEVIVERWLPQFLLPGGLVTALDSHPGRQWAYPNGWAPLQWLAATGLERYGFKAEANEVRRRWCDTCTYAFTKAGTLAEKYNVADPHAEPEHGLYGLVQGFGWTNGVFVDFARSLAST
ncbi:alpha,alpha-trehalase [Gemmata sp. JC673]|uniref:Alpha,alpha-trehalase n=1 Tax=Gemmata algarum TaxID=2975278 RepID=A0ABU5F0S3_9BACT|nr:trehalase family glycosidase [Gemmata algarum]MDY3561099.1 alpha,alpha-trehalase [Gemmata algarum]